MCGTRIHTLTKAHRTHSFNEMIRRNFFYWTVESKLMNSFDINEIITTVTNKWEKVGIIVVVARSTGK